MPYANKPAKAEWSQSGDVARPPDGAVSPGYVAYVIGLLVVVNIVNYIDRMALAVLAPAIKADLDFTDGELGLLIGFAFSLFYAICGLPIALWADRGVRRNIIAAALAVWSVMTALCGAAQSFWQLFAARVGVGAGEAGCLPPAQSIICDYVPVESRSGVFAIHSLGLYLGMMIGMSLAGILAAAIGWRLAFVVLGLPGVLLAIIVRLTLREPARGGLDRAAAGNESPGQFQSLWRSPTYRLLLLALVANGFVQQGLLQWWPSYLVRFFGVEIASAGVMLGLAIGIGSGTGILVGGWLGNMLARRGVGRPLVLGAATTVLVIPVAIATIFAASTTQAVMAILLTAFFWSISNGPVIASLYTVVAPTSRALAGATTIFFTAAFGQGLGPVLVGLASDALRGSVGDDALRYAMLLPIALIPMLVVALWFASRALVNELRTSARVQ